MALFSVNLRSPSVFNRKHNHFIPFDREFQALQTIAECSICGTRRSNYQNRIWPIISIFHQSVFETRFTRITTTARDSPSQVVPLIKIQVEIVCPHAKSFQRKLADPYHFNGFWPVSRLLVV